MATAGSIVVDLLMRTGSFETDTDRASKQVRKFGKDSQAAAADVGAAFGKIGGAVVGGLAVAGTAILKWTRQLATASGEIERFARLSGTSEQTFQRLAAGASTVGIQQDKLSDIFKDTQDKVGDFLQNGGGELQDFFTNIAPKVGLTAKEFRNLSGPEALGKYYSALEKAGVSQGDMVFYLEAIANDASLLAPLLANNGEGFRKWGDEAERLGVVLDAQTTKSLKELRLQTSEMELAFQGLKNQVGAELLPQVKELTAFMGSDSTKSAIVNLTTWVGGLTAEMANGVVMLVNYMGRLKELRDLEGANTSALGDASTEALNEQLGAVSSQRRLIQAVEPESVKKQEQLNDLLRQQLALQREITKRNRPEVKLLENGAMPDDAALVRPAKTATFEYTDKEAGKVAAELQKTYTAMSAELAKQLALNGQNTEYAKVLYELQSGSLKGITGAQAQSLLQLAEIKDVNEDIAAIYGATDEKVNTYLAGLERELALHGQIGEAVKVAYDIRTGAFGALSEEQARLLESYAQTKDAMDDYAAIYGEGYDSMIAKTKEGSDMMKEFGLEAARSMQGAFSDFLFDPFEEGLGGMVKGFAKTIQRMLADLAASQLLKALGTMAASSGNSWVAAIGGAIAGGRAGGGPVAAGSIYEVGEGGRPEMYEAGGRTYMIPGNQGGRVVPITAGRPVTDAATGAGGGVSLHISNVIQNDGTASTSAQGDENDMLRALNQMIQPMVLRVLQQQMRPGGLFAPGGARG
ncbi:hypothetical protein KWH04_15785 [Xanthomonas campestris pv. trichodesmae]|uniref:Phage tail tape measure protein n=2 Tax=Xanthomonas citri TaxID=346 RepID=A0AB33CKX7_XANCI|nr:hypothetical protein [Xanthomonas citri]ASK92625.1 hypothetical protein XcvCFBP7111P_15010 [Xanthomonas citri pv. vignicola]MBV6782071.1 hypothetical protein [Xanthomonas campestris pv. trichodesmae]MBZ3920439.1 hypothetical protein [Xanthomonas campestris pv. trichodesmae]MBZ3923792.1 hypothetical protein [Xanthomonas citri pv. sesbaniae]